MFAAGIYNVDRYPPTCAFVVQNRLLWAKAIWEIVILQPAHSNRDSLIKQDIRDERIKQCISQLARLFRVKEMVKTLQLFLYEPMSFGSRVSFVAICNLAIENFKTNPCVLT